MKPSLLPLLACPRCRSQLALGAQTKRDGHIEEGTLSCTGCGAAYPISGSIPRFVPRQNYAEGFGFQWNRFRRTQLDSHSGLTISHDRLLRQTGWPQESFRDARVLDIGCGAGRFAEVALGLGAEVFAVDYSTAVDATLENLGNHPRLNVVQGDLYHLPFAANSFDMLYCFGVIQHTPDPYRAVLSLPALLTGGGYLAVDVYPRRWTNALLFRYWLRPITTRMPQDRLFRIVQRATPFLLSVSRAIGRIPSVGRYLRRLVPVVNYEGIFPLTDEQLLEWGTLDTFDMLSPRYDQPQTRESLRRWLAEAGLDRIEVCDMGFLVGRGRKSRANGSTHTMRNRPIRPGT